MLKTSATLRLAIGMAMLSVSLLLVAGSLGVGPNEDRKIMEGRSTLCEAVAISSSLFASKNDVKSVDRVLQAVVSRNPDLLSAAVRRDNELLVEIGEHRAHWQVGESKTSTDAQMYVPILSGEAIWGTVEMRFRPLRQQGVIGWWKNPATLQMIFLGASSVVVFFWYLSKVLRRLDPSKVVPSRVRNALDTLAAGLFVLDRNERIVLANQAFASAVGKTPEQLQGFQASDLPWVAKQESEDESHPWSAVLKDGMIRTGGVLEYQPEDSDPRTYIVNSAPIVNDKGARCGVLASFEDVTMLEKKKAELREMLSVLKKSRDEVRIKNEELKVLATRDPLTSCLNRRSFFERFETHWSNAKRYGHPISCIMVDIDHFKSVNDNHGHSTGDIVLKEIAAALQSASRESDEVCRYGGEEFCVLLPSLDLDGATQAAERFREAVEAAEPSGLKVTASLGVSSICLGANDPQSMLDQADKCLYVAKRNGRNQVVRWDLVPDDIEVDESKVSRTESESESEDSTALPLGDALKLGTLGDIEGIGMNEPEPPEESIHFGAVSALISALAYRDGPTADHSRRVADLCIAVGERILSMREAYVLEVAALLHDIGKIGVPDAILLKPGPLTNEEWEVMDLHDRIGVEIVGATFASEMLIQIIENHHAHFAGETRHAHLPTGKAIPVGARILSIADAYDAIVSDRVYRKGRKPEEAFKELRRCAGTQFDPDIVEEFIDAVQASATSRMPAMPDLPKQTAVRIGTQIERLAEALDHEDFEGLCGLAGRLHQVAEKDGADDIAQTAHDLEAASCDMDLAETVRLTMELLSMCRATQNAYLRTSWHRDTNQAISKPSEQDLVAT